MMERTYLHLEIIAYEKLLTKLKKIQQDSSIPNEESQVTETFFTFK